MSIHGFKRNFNSGELSPLLDARVDVDRYTGGARVVRNFIPRTYGAAFKRPGTIYLGQTKNNAVARLVPFNYSVDTRFQLEFSDLALRFWSNDLQVEIDPSDAPDWTSASTGGPDFYALAGTVWYGAASRIYGATSQHTPTADNAPASSKWSESPAKRWIAGETYTKGDIVGTSDAGAEIKALWLVLANHTATSTTPDVDTTNYAPLWHKLASGAYTPTWTTGESYVLGEKVIQSFQSGSGATLKTFYRAYRCKSAHTAGASTKPGVGSSWNTRWTECTAPLAHNTASISYYVGDLVKVGTTAYISTTAHTSSTSNEPGDVGSPWVALSNTVAWVTASTARTVGAWIMVGGTLVMCTTAHTSLTTLTTSIGTTTRFVFPTFDSSEWKAKDSYDVGVYVVLENNLYVCTQDHTYDAGKEPGTAGGADYWQKLGNISVWTGGQDYQVGQYVTNGGNIYICLVENTAGFNPATSAAEDTDASGPPDERIYWPASTDIQPDDEVIFNYALGYAPAQNAGLAPDEGVIYYCVDRGTDGLLGEWFKVSDTLGGTALIFADNWSSGQVQVRRVTPGTEPTYDGTFATDLAYGWWELADYPLEIETPWPESILFSLQWVQINDILVFVNQSYRPYALKRIRDDVWTIAEIDWDFPPLRDENIEEDVTMTPSATTGSITVTCNKAVFTEDHVGSYWMIGHRRDTAFQKVTFAADTTSAGMRIIGRWDLFTYGFWTADLVLQRSKDGSTNWQSVRTWSSNGNGTAGQRNFVATGTELEECYLRLVVQNRTQGAATDFATLEAAESRVEGCIKVTAVNSFTNVSATVIKDLQATTATTIWAEGAFSDERGWPRGVTLHEQRLWFAGCDAQPLTVWGSQINDFYNFRLGTNDAASLSLSLASPEANAIQWIQSLNNGLVLATVGDEWLMESGDSSKAITPTQVRVKRQSRYGSTYIPGVLLGDAVVFLQRSAQKLREFTYQFEVDKFVAPDLTLLAEHIAASGIKQMSAQLQPDTILWGVTNDGRLIGMTYERQQDVVAWHQHDSGTGVFESVSCIYGGQGEADQVWMIVRRTIGAQTKRYIERFDANTAGYRFSQSNSSLVYCDSAKVFASPGTTVTGLDHLEGQAVSVLADGVIVTGKAVSGGSITLDTGPTVLVVGLPFTAKLQSMKIELELQDGTAQGRTFSLNEVVLRFFKSAGCEIIADPDDSSLTWRAIGNQANVTTLSSADVEQSLASRNQRAVQFQLRSSLPVPTNILAIIYKFDVHGD